MFFENVEEVFSAVEADHEVGEELSPGVTIERRQILRFGAVVSAAVLTGSMHRRVLGQDGPATTDATDATDTAKAAEAGRRISISEMVKQIEPMAKKLVGEKAPDEEAYLKAVAAILHRLEPIAPADFRPSAYDMQISVRFPPVVAYQLHFKPGATIRLHDHRNYNGVLLGIEGKARCRNFDIHNEDPEAPAIPPNGEDFLIRQTADLVLAAGKTSSLSRKRDNIHEVTASEETRLYDIFTFFDNTAGSHYLDWDDKPFDREKKLYKVQWIS